MFHNVTLRKIGSVLINQIQKAMVKISFRFIYSLVAFMLISVNLMAQDDEIKVRDDHATLTSVSMTHTFDFGIGLGLDYGGVIGIQLEVAPIKHLTLFGAIGYEMIQMGWNVGIKGLLLPKTTDHVARPYLKIMYGCHSVIAVEGTDKYDKVYNGFTPGLGLELRFGKYKKNGLDLDLNVPLRTPEFWHDYNVMLDDPSLSVTQGPLPVAFSVGYHHEF